MSKCLKVFSLVTAIVAVNSGIVGCAFSKNKDKNDDQKKAEVLLETDQLRDQEFKVEIVETDKLNEYFVKFSWPAGRGIRVEVQEDDLIVDSKGENSIAIPVGGGEKHKFNIEAYNSIGGSILRKVIPQDIPEDLIVNENVNADADLVWEYNRIVVSKDTTIRLNGHDLSISADRIRFEFGAMLETRSATKYAPSEEMLRGSKIEIHARQAHGMLRMIMSGFMGRDGRSGDQVDKDNGFADPYLPELKGAAGRHGEHKPNTNKESEGYRCSVSPTDGAQGKQGAPGTDGEDGQPGGNTGSLDIQLMEGRNSNLMVEVVAKPGRPGRGGAGGMGRRGGAGGDPGMSVEGCRNARRGPDGPRGEVGKSGRDGEIGKVGAMTASPGVTLKVRE